ncbi:MAG: Rid family hydrolase [Candidatus Ratteibacteria bacterium]
MVKEKIEIKNIPVDVNYSYFKGESDIEEYHFSFIPKGYEDFKTQLKWIYRAYTETLKIIGIEEGTSVFRRFFCSDLYNQIIYLKDMEFSNPENNSNPTSISLISQPPLLYPKVSLWAYHIKGKIQKKKQDKNVSIKFENLIHNWTTGLINTDSDSIYEQTKKILENYIKFLEKNNMKLSENVIRTWFFIKNIDTDYREFVASRREIYEKNGLTKDTHFIASTGVGGSYFDLKAKVILDVYSISGIKKHQIKFLSAPDYLSPTYIYGVTFERGVSITYSDRKHIIISGTASINNKGKIMYPNDIIRQTGRTLKNIEALLKNENATLEDMMIFIVYLRDPSDYYFVEKIIRKRFKNTPIIFANASICRPGWLVEIEGIAVSPLS